MFVARTRFSLFLPKSKGWNISRDFEDIENYKKTLYEEKRLNFRINFLMNIILPLLEVASEGYKFLHIIEYSESLPIKYIKDLERLEEKYSFLKLNLFYDNGDPQYKTNSMIMDYFDLSILEDDVWIGRFVLDDDDCVSLNYFRIMSDYLTKCYEGFYISLGSGVVGVFDDNYRPVHYAEMYKPKVNIGFMNVGKYSFKDKKVYFSKKGAPHMSMDKVNRVILDSRYIGFYWSRHAYQDTRLNKSQNQIEKIIASLEALPVFTKEQFDI
ncbi:glycosyltransferase [Psychrobacter sp. NPDC078501]|uniref:glycosyltransferase n=1 Tax=Psychrobacter sp. NPDC078501 TaxID=3364495 RepID=UPI00384BEF24